MKQLADHDFALGFSKEMSNEDYHKADALSSSGVRLIGKSLALYKHSLTNPVEQTAAMRFGSIVHDLILLPTEALSKYDIQEKRPRKKPGEVKNTSVITSEEYLEACAMRESVYKHKSAKALLENAHNEQSFFWKDIELGINCKCRPDTLREGHIIVDLKTTDDASPKGFQRSLANFGYHQQAAFYLDGMSAVTSANYDTFVIIAVEKKAPYNVATYVLDKNTIEAGRYLNRKAMEAYSEAKSTGMWSAYSEEILPLSLPNWAFPQEEK